ncbi:hypothetical protein [Salana multivorans]
MGVLVSGRFRARYTGPDGVQRSAPATFATRREAEAWLATVQADTLRGVWAPPERAAVLLGEYLATWQRLRAPRLKPRTRDLYARLAERWLLAPAGTGRATVDLARVPLAALTPTLVREWFAAVCDAAAASASAREPATRTHPARAWATQAGRPRVAHRTAARRRAGRLAGRGQPRPRSPGPARRWAHHRRPGLPAAARRAGRGRHGRADSHQPGPHPRSLATSSTPNGSR